MHGNLHAGLLGWARQISWRASLLDSGHETQCPLFKVSLHMLTNKDLRNQIHPTTWHTHKLVVHALAIGDCNCEFQISSFNVRTSNKYRCHCVALKKLCWILRLPLSLKPIHTREKYMSLKFKRPKSLLKMTIIITENRSNVDTLYMATLSSLQCYVY